MKKKIFLVIAIMAVLACIFAISTSAAVSAPVKPNIGVDFGGSNYYWRIYTAFSAFC